MKILLDPGHGGADPGAVNQAARINEKDLNLDVCLALGPLLESAGHVVLYTRTGDASISPSARLALIRKWQPNAFISVHCNSANNPQAHGIETIYRDDYDRNLAICVQSELVAATHMNNRGIKCDGSPEYHRNLAVLKDDETPAILVEIGFLSNTEDLRQMQNTQRIAQAIANGVQAWRAVNGQ
jgi:N-acetylmuramoyl-L-alanine amidase